eukprot:5631547-Lingulodinium_polyedra.AAC.1
MESARLRLRTYKGDVKAAFLQGDLAEEAGSVFVEPVPELAQATGLRAHECAKLVKSVYGLVEAPRRWWMRVGKDLEAAGWRRCKSE